MQNFDIEYFKSLRTEIISVQKTRLPLILWKVIIISLFIGLYIKAPYIDKYWFVTLIGLIAGFFDFVYWQEVKIIERIGKYINFKEKKRTTILWENHLLDTYKNWFQIKYAMIIFSILIITLLIII